MILIENLTKVYENHILFHELNLQLDAGKVYALIGESGSGKTTLLNIMAQLEPYDDGQVYFRNDALDAIKPYDFFRNHLGYLFQNFGLIENQTIADNLDLGLIGQKMSKQERQNKQLEALTQVNLSYLNLSQKIYSLSGGEAQRVALAKVILKNPTLIFADEPTAALDPTNGSEMMSLLLSLKNSSNLIVIATHNPSIWNMADEVIDLDSFATRKLKGNASLLKK